MPDRRLSFGSCASATMAAVLVVSLATAGRGSFQAAQSAPTSSKDPFQVAEKSAGDTSAKTDAKSAEKKTAEPEFVRKTEEEWAKILNPSVFRVTRWKETEPAFSGRYATGHFRGTFLCACCNAELFNADHKFDSGTGWPSFWRPISAKAFVNAVDNSEAEQRIEVMCRRCGAHLGHVFDDNPDAATGLRYCINSLSLKLKPPEGTAAKTTSGKGKTKARTAAKTRSKKTPTKPSAKTTTPEPEESSGEKSSSTKPGN